MALRMFCSFSTGTPLMEIWQIQAKGSTRVSLHCPTSLRGRGKGTEASILWKWMEIQPQAPRVPVTPTCLLFCHPPLPLFNWVYAPHPHTRTHAAYPPAMPVRMAHLPARYLSQAAR